MKKRVLTFLLAVAFIVSCLSMVAFAETTEVEALELPEKILLSTNGDSVDVYPDIIPADADESLAWQISDKSIVSVTQRDGGAYVELIGKKAGIATLTVKSGNVVSNECEITVSSKETIWISDEELTMSPGETTGLSFEYVPEEDSEDPDPSVSWTSTNPGVARVSNSGIVTAISKGTAEIRVNKGGATATCKVTVLEEHDITLDDKNKENVTIKVAGNYKTAVEGRKLIVYASPVEEDDYYVQKIYVVGDDSEEEIASMENTKKAKGQQRLDFVMPDEDITVYATVIAFDPNKKPLKAITLNKEKISMPVDTKFALKVTYDPEDTTESKDVKWESMNEDIAAVDENGVITAVKAGSTAITANVGKLKASINVTVEGKISKVEIDSKDFELKVKEEKSLKAKYTPSMPEGLLVEWASSDEKVAKVDENGKVTGVGEGTATITAKVGGKAATVKVTVIKPVGDFSIVVNKANYGTAETSKTTADKNEFIVITVKPEKGYKLGALQVVDEKGKKIAVESEKDNEFVFQMPESNVVVSVSFVKEGTDPETRRFVDVPKGIWYEEAVNYAADKGYLNGVGNNHFDPNGAVTRGQLCTILYAMEGKPTITGGKDFPDVKADKYYYDPIRWASSNDMVAGYTDGTFKPDVFVSRQQLAAVLYKYASYKKYDLSVSANITTFADYSAISNYAITPMRWAVSHKVMSGTDRNTLLPQSAASRAQFAVMLKAFDTSFGR